MADIFGKSVRDYQTLTNIEKVGNLPGHLQAQCEMAMERKVGRMGLKKHDFYAFNFSNPESVKKMASGSLGYFTNNFQALVSMGEEVWYRKHILPEFIPVIVGGVPEGVDSYSVEVKNRVGRGRLAGTYGSQPPTVDSNIRKYAADLWLGNIEAAYTDEDMRNALHVGRPLQASKIEDAMVGANNHLEIVGFQGDEDIPGSTGIFNQATTGNSATASRVTPGSAIITATGATATDNWVAFEAKEKVDALNAIIGKIIVDTNELITRRDNTGDLCIVMAPDIFNITSTEAYGDNANQSVMDYVAMKNPWTNRTNRNIMFKSLSELSDLGTAVSAGNNTSVRMAIYVKDEDIMEMRLAFAPRLMRVFQEARQVTLPFEYKFGTLQVKRNNCIVYFDDL